MKKWLRLRWRRTVVLDPTVPIRDSDARRADAPSRRGEPDPELERAAKLRRRALQLFFYVVFVAGVLGALMGKNGYFDLLRLRSERDATQAALIEQRDRVDELQRVIRALENDPTARERIAREELNLAYPGEVQFLLPREGREPDDPFDAPSSEVQPGLLPAD